MKNHILSSNIKNRSTEFQSWFSGLMIIHLVIIIGMGLLNLFVPLLKIDFPGALLLWVFIFGIIFSQFILQSLIHSERHKAFIDRFLLTIILFFFFLFLWRIIQVYWSIDDIETLKAAAKTAILGVFVVSVYYSFAQITNIGLKRIAIIMPTVLLWASLFAFIWLLFSEGGFSLYAERKFKHSITLFGGSNTAATIILLLGLWNWKNILGDTLKIKSIGICNGLITTFLLIGIASYAALAGYLSSLVLLLLLFLWKKKRGSLLFFVSAIAGVAIVVFFLSGYVFTSDISLEDKMFRTGYQRTLLWSEAWEIIKDGAWLNGVGSAAYSKPMTIFSEPLGGGIHNALLQSWLEGGIVELALHVGLYIWLIKIGLKHFSKEGIVLVCTLLGMFVRNLAESNGILFGLLNNYNVFLSWYIVVFLVILLKKEIQNKTRGIKL